MDKIFFQKRFIFLTCVIFYFFSNAWAMTYSSDSSNNKFISYTVSGDGRPLLLIHAFPTDQQLWEPQRKKLQKYFRVITLDLWGFGKSTATDGKAMTMTDYADEVKQLLDQLQIQKAIIGGESMGGYIALAFLEKYPEKVDGLVLSDTQAIGDNAEMKAKREASAIDVLEHGTENLINGFMPKALSTQASEQKKLFLKHILDNQKKEGVASALRGMATRNDTSNILANTQLPILILTGDQDVVIAPQQSENMHALAKNSKLVVIPHAGHLSSVEQPEKWNQAIVDVFYDPTN